MLNDSKVVSGVHTCFKALVSSPQGPASTSTNGRIRKTFCAEMMEECVYTQPLLTTVVITSKGFIKAKNAPHSDETLLVMFSPCFVYLFFCFFLSVFFLVFVLHHCSMIMTKETLPVRMRSIILSFMKVLLIFVFDVHSHS